jgi:hypothetical protein
MNTPTPTPTPTPARINVEERIERLARKYWKQQLCLVKRAVAMEAENNPRAAASYRNDASILRDCVYDLESVLCDVLHQELGIVSHGVMIHRGDRYARAATRADLGNTPPTADTPNAHATDHTK